MSDQPDTKVIDVPERNRFELHVDGETVGFASYRDSGRGVVFPHTEITPRLRGQGLSHILIRGALDAMRERGEQVIPMCWAVSGFIDENPEYADLVTGR